MASLLPAPVRHVFLMTALIAALGWSGAPAALAADEAPPRRLEIIDLLKLHEFETLKARLSDDGPRVRDDYEKLFAYSDPAIEADLTAWVEASPDIALPHAARAAYYRHIAWRKRGGKYVKYTHARQFAAYKRYQALAARDYRRALDLDDGIGEAYAGLYNIALSLSDESTANSVRRAGLSRARNTVPLHLAILERLEPQWGGSWEQVGAYISGLLRRDPRPELTFLSGYLDEVEAWRLIREEQFDAALEIVDRLISNADTPDRQYHRTVILMDLGRWDESLESANRAIAEEPDSHSHYLLRAAIHRARGDENAALSDSAFALALDPYNPGLLVRRSVAFVRERAVLADRASPDDIAALDARRGEVLRKALVHGEHNASVHKELGKYYAWQPNGKDKAIEHHMRSVELMPHVPVYWIEFAETLLLHKDCRAVETARRYLNVCNAAGDCTPNKGLVEVIETNLASCQAPQMSKGVELPQAPKRAAELDKLMRCGQFFGGQDDTAAIRACLELAETNDPDAQYDMGMLYVYSGSQLSIRGAGDAHLALAVEWLNKALAQDHGGAAAVLGSMYLHGVSVPKDVTAALGLLGRAAEQGNVIALMSLALAYHRAIGVPKDVSKAKAYYRQAAELGGEDAARSLDRLEDEKG